MKTAHPIAFATLLLATLGCQAATVMQFQPQGKVAEQNRATVRFSAERMAALAPELLATAQQLAAASGASPFFTLTAETGAPAGAEGRKPIYAV